MEAAATTSRPLLDIPAARSHLHRVTVTEYHRQLDSGAVSERTELLEGLVYEKMGKSPLHEQLSLDVFLFFHACLAGHDYLVRKEAPLTLEESEPEPDISIVRGSRPKDFVAGHPTSAELVVEVAVSEPEVDRAKGRIYAAAGVPEYWVVLAKERRIEVYSAPDSQGRKYDRVQGYGAGERVPTIGGLELEVSTLFA